eukprot:9036179-Alexandrium_andersonii.AAC.1
MCTKWYGYCSGVGAVLDPARTLLAGHCVLNVGVFGKGLDGKERGETPWQSGPSEHHRSQHHGCKKRDLGSSGVLEVFRVVPRATSEHTHAPPPVP